VKCEIDASKLTPTIEDYLGQIYTLERDGESVIGARLADLLGVTAPTVTVTLQRMARDGWIVMEGRKGVRLTDIGMRAAQDVIRRHMLTEWMLARVLHVPWSDVHSEAHVIEHTISANIEQRMRDQFDDPQVCPHGNPLPGHEDISVSWVALKDVTEGRRVIIRRVHEHAEDKAEILKYLETNRILPGIEALVKQILPFNQTITLEREGELLMIGMQLAGYIYVELIPDEESRA